jgi:mono/diheme cytochrome c family protein
LAKSRLNSTVRVLSKFHLAAIVAVALFAPPRSAAEVRFNRDVRPILSDNCFACHGPDAKQRKAGLRLDLRDDALKPAKSGAAPIVPGAPGKSSVIARIETNDPDALMPPPKSHKQLSTAQKELLKRWIAEGAKFEAHWAFTPIERPAPPAVNDKSRPRNATALPSG